MWRILLLTFLGKIWCADGACEPIRIEMCRGLGYNVTAMPNLVGHEIQGDADFTLQTFSPLIQYGCSTQLHLFLCAVYAPMCTDKVSSPIGPCRGLCEQVRARCFPVLQGFGFPWPAALNCSKFPPENNHQHMCMEGPGEPGFAHPIQAVGAGSAPWGCSWYAKSGLYIFLNRSGRCAAACDADILWSQKDKRLIEAWLAAFTTVCLISIVVAIFTVLKLRKQHTVMHAIERAILFLSVCHAAIAVGYVVRLAAGRITVACTSATQLHPQGQVIIAQQQQQHLTQDGLSNPYCAIVFVLLYYFGNAAYVWWVVVCGWWSMAIRKWIQPASNCKPGEFGEHEGLFTIGAVAAWGIPAAFTIAVLVLRDVDADELTGSCYVGQQDSRSLMVLVLIPQLLYHAFGMTFLLVGGASLLLPRPSVPVTPASNPLHPGSLTRQKESAKVPGRTHKEQRVLITRVGIFACLYTLAMLCLSSVTFYEWWGRDAWLRAPEPSAAPRMSSKPMLQFFVLRLVVTFGAGIIAAAWIWWPNVISLWRRLPPCKQSPYKCQPHAVVHCYSAASTSPMSRQVQHPPRPSSIQQPFLHSHPIAKESQTLHRSHKKHRNCRKYHSGSETQV
ncbi:hypothetical protein KM043_017781 [Ampulex compressa]|nr:hypothetical protein KM043_017781 [Ampulex compressa]